MIATKADALCCSLMVPVGVPLACRRCYLLKMDWSHVSKSHNGQMSTKQVDSLVALRLKTFLAKALLIYKRISYYYF